MCRRLQSIKEECLDVDSMPGGQCLPSGTFAHLSESCLAAHALGVSDVDGATVGAIVDAFTAVHIACQAFTSQVQYPTWPWGSSLPEPTSGHCVSLGEGSFTHELARFSASALAIFKVLTISQHV